MKLNEHDAILTPKILLVPYSEHHVPTYHEWMQDEDLQKATASEPLTLPEEYAMQKSWRTDADKLTFIVCTAPSTNLAGSSPLGTQQTQLAAKSRSFQVEPGKADSPNTMIGDVNLFLCPDEEEDDEEKKLQALVGEVEIMIASKAHQGKGLGKEILLTFLWYIMTSLSGMVSEYHSNNGQGKSESYLKYLRVKIDKDNARSIRLFEAAGFRKVSEEPNFFGELELRWPISGSSLQDVEGKLEDVPLKREYES